ncbi:MAG TPA: DNA polymerase III subunit gamma/tau [Coriobacteriia bacterium]
MAYQSLYRTYRPQSFGDIVGQDHVTQTLRNAVAEGSVAHAYLFCGPRGTGKTSAARILAKALDCEQGPTPDPDNTCEQCREITEGRHPDVYEIDAASRTGVDALRDEVISKVNYAATHGGFKVYIIDEVHMLSTSAFNALLKTLEEPPPKTVFVLCTTHPHKVPETIHSRCQRFDFRRIGTEDIVGRLEYIAREESIAVEEGSLTLIARHAAGGMRDAIGTLDQLAAFTGKSIAVADVEGLLGEVDTAQLFRAVDLIASRDVAGLFGFVADLVESGHDVPEFVRALTAHVRDLYVVAAAGDTVGIVDHTAADLERLRAQTARFDLDRLARLLDELGRLSGELRWAPDARLALEVALARVARPVSDLTLGSLAERVASLEAGVTAVAAPVPAPATLAATATAPAPKPAPKRAATPSEASAAAQPTVPALPASEPDTQPQPEAPAPAAAAPAGDLDVGELRRRWKDVINEVKRVRPAASKLFMDTEAALEGDTVVVEFDPTRRVLVRAAEEQDVVALLRDSIRIVLGWHVAIRYQLGRGAVRPADDALSAGHPTAHPSPVPADPDALDRALVEGLGALRSRDDTDPSGDASSALLAPAPVEADRLDQMLFEGLGAEIVSTPSDEDPEVS